MYVGMHVIYLDAKSESSLVFKGTNTHRIVYIMTVDQRELYF